MFQQDFRMPQKKKNELTINFETPTISTHTQVDDSGYWTQRDPAGKMWESHRN